MQIICYALFQGAAKYPTGMTAVSHERVRMAGHEMADHLEAMGYFKLADERKWTEQLLADICERAALSESEMQRFEKIFRKAELISRHKGASDES